MAVGSAKIGVISLGCAKNRVDTEVLIGILQEHGYEFVQEMSEADVILVNTCSFIEEASEEGLATILEAGEQVRFGSAKGLVVAGCMSQRFGERLRQFVPQANVLIGAAGYKDIVEAVQAALEGRYISMFSDLALEQPFEKRVLTTARPTAYVKIAEGCDNNCTYCVIPSIRGRFQSRTVEDIHREVADLAGRGYSEIILVAQDTSRYGQDLEERPTLAALMDDLAGIEGLKWLRVLYTYPEGVTDELLEVMASHDNVPKYLDIPMQHMADRILRRMNRHTTGEENLELVRRVRAAHPDFVIRSTFIAGFPGETQEEFEGMLHMLSQAKLDHVGAFPYSREEGTPAAGMPDQVDHETKIMRRDAIMRQQGPISLERNQGRVGRECDILIEGYDASHRVHYGRTWAEAPEVDGLVFVEAPEPIVPDGTFVRGRITRASHYDSVAELIQPEEDPA